MQTTYNLDRVSVVLVSPRNPLNIGAAARAMSNFGILRLRVVNPYEVSFREAKSAVGAFPVLASAEEFSTVGDAVADITFVVGTTAGTNRDLRQSLYSLEQSAELLQRKTNSGSIALLFGSEKRGLSNEDLAHCHALLRIPTRDEHSSMNLGQAVAVCLYELNRNPQVFSSKDELPRATVAEEERLKHALLECLQQSDYTTTQTAASVEEKLRRMLKRLRLQSDDAEVLLGMFRKISWKLKQK